MTQKRLRSCRFTTAGHYISQCHSEVERKKSYVPNSGYINDLPMMVIRSYWLHSFQSSLEITQMDSDAHKALLDRLHFLPRISSTAYLRLKVQIWGEGDNTTTISQKTLLHFSSTSTTRLQSSYLTELSRHDIAPFEVGSLPYALLSVQPSHYTHVCILGRANLTYHHRWLRRSKLVMKVPPHTVSPADTISRHPFESEGALCNVIKLPYAPLKVLMARSTTCHILSFIVSSRAC